MSCRGSCSGGVTQKCQSRVEEFSSEKGSIKLNQVKSKLSRAEELPKAVKLEAQELSEHKNNGWKSVHGECELVVIKIPPPAPPQTTLLAVLDNGQNGKK